jgi:aminopeptidase N
MPSLTRTEASERAALLSVHDYRIVLDLAAEGPDFGSDTIIRFQSRTVDASTFLDIQASRVEQVTLNGEPVAPDTVKDGRLELKGLAAENVLQVTARMTYSSDGEGLHRHVDPTDGRTYLYGMSFLDAAPRWFACFDQPDLKARFTVKVTCPRDWTVLGNGPASQTAPGHWQVAPTKPLSTYFVALVAGPYHSVAADHDGIRLGLHARASLAPFLDAEAEDMLQVTRSAFDRYHELFGIRYPFGEYHQAFVPDFNAGAMENPGCVTLRDQYVFRSAATHAERGVRAGTIVHELAHMWFGDLVTMRWWDDLWLNESFAEYMAQRVCTEVTDYPAWTEFGIHRKDWGYVADQAPSTHPIAGNGSEDAASALADFDGISYAKGASVLKQLAAHLGDEVFFGGLRDYFAQHSYGNAEFGDLMRAWTAAGARDLDTWAAQWLRTSGLDTLSAHAVDGKVMVRRSVTGGVSRPHAVRVAAFDTTGARVLDEPITITEDLVMLDSAQPVRLVVADGADDTWAKIRTGDWSAVHELLPLISDDATRVVLYNSIRDAVRDAELDPALALAMLLDALQSEPQDLVVAEMFRFATLYLAGPYSPAHQRVARCHQIAASASSVLAAAGPGSDAQLETARALIHATDDHSLLRDWLDESAVPSGLRMDAELRWAVLCRLAALGRASEIEIGAELSRDPSTSGVVHAARARALRPDVGAKQAAWQLLTEPNSMPAYELYATAEGFFHPDQDELTAGYVTRFFTEIPATAQHRTGWALAKIVLLSYPTTATSATTLGLAERALANTTLDSGVRRSLVDGTDVLRRAVRSLERYGSA